MERILYFTETIVTNETEKSEIAELNKIAEKPYEVLVLNSRGAPTFGSGNISGNYANGTVPEPFKDLPKFVPSTGGNGGGETGGSSMPGMILDAVTVAASETANSFVLADYVKDFGADTGQEPTYLSAYSFGVPYGAIETGPTVKLTTPNPGWYIISFLWTYSDGSPRNSILPIIVE